jgi:hypothetical protein
VQMPLGRPATPRVKLLLGVSSFGVFCFRQTSICMPGFWFVSNWVSLHLMDNYLYVSCYCLFGNQSSVKVKPDMLCVN